MKEGLDTVRTKVQALTSKVGGFDSNYVTVEKLLLLYGCSPYMPKEASHVSDICMLSLTKGQNYNFKSEECQSNNKRKIYPI